MLRALEGLNASLLFLGGDHHRDGDRLSRGLPAKPRDNLRLLQGNNLPDSLHLEGRTTVLLRQMSSSFETDPGGRKTRFDHGFAKLLHIQGGSRLEPDIRPRLPQTDFHMIHAIQAGEGLVDPVRSYGSYHPGDAHLHVLELGVGRGRGEKPRCQDQAEKQKGNQAKTRNLVHH